MKRLAAVLAAVCAAAAALPLATALRAVPPAIAATTRTVAVKDSVFGPTALTVRRGTTVRWVWRGTRLPHNVAVQKGPRRFRSGAPKKQGSFSATLRVAGTYVIHCEIHQGMRMTLKVRP